MKGKVETVWAKYDHRLDIDVLENICYTKLQNVSFEKKLGKNEYCKMI